MYVTLWMPTTDVSVEGRAGEHCGIGAAPGSAVTVGVIVLVVGAIVGAL